MIRGTNDRVSADRTLPMHDSAAVLALRLGKFQHEIHAIRTHYSSQHKNYHNIDAEHSKWHVWNSAVEVSRESVARIQVYLHKTGQGQAACLSDMCVTPGEFSQRLGAFSHFCPVSLADRSELVDCARVYGESLQYAAEFRGYYYRLAGAAELEAFLQTPERYVPPHAPCALPPENLLPTRVSPERVKQKFPQSIELMGYCPVTYADGKMRYESIVPGDANLVVEYMEKLYQMESEEKLEQFLRTPDRYANLVLPHKRPPPKQDILVTKLPMLGYMEQSVSQSLQKALTAVGCFKPKFPFMSPTQSALIYVAYHLKAFNPKNSDYVRAKYKKKLENFEDTCSLINYLGDRMTVKFKENRERPIDFDHKLNQFLKLESCDVASLVA